MNKYPKPAQTYILLLNKNTTPPIIYTKYLYAIKNITTFGVAFEEAMSNAKARLNKLKR